MFNVSTVKTALFGMIGLKDSANPSIPINTLTGASQSVYFNDYHPLVTFDNLYSIAPDYNGLDYADWFLTG